MPKKKSASTPGTFIQRSRRLGAAEKAAYHQVTGAGKRHVKRRFFDLTDADLDAIAARAFTGIRDLIRNR